MHFQRWRFETKKLLTIVLRGHQVSTVSQSRKCRWSLTLLCSHKRESLLVFLLPNMDLCLRAHYCSCERCSVMQQWKLIPRAFEIHTALKKETIMTGGFSFWVHSFCHILEKPQHDLYPWIDSSHLELTFHTLALCLQSCCGLFHDGIYSSSSKLESGKGI